MGIEDRKQRERVKRRKTIIDAALHVFLKKGVSGTTMEEIAEKAELSKATLYLYFKNKEELFLHVLVIVFGKFVELIEEGLSSTTGALERLRSVGRSYLKFYSNYHNYYRLMNAFDKPTDFDFTTYETSQDLIVVNTKIWELVCTPIIEGMASGVFKADTMPMEIGITLWTSSTGVMNLWDHMKYTNHPHFDTAEVASECAYSQMPNVSFERILYNLWDAIFSSIMADNK